MRMELRIGLLLNAIGIIVSRFGFFPVNANEFMAGLFMSLGIFLLVINAVPEKTYKNLLYRKWIANKKA